MKMNQIEIALNGTDEDLDFYLSDVTKDEFRQHIADLKTTSANKEAIKQAIAMLQKFVDE